MPRPDKQVARPDKQVVDKKIYESASTLVRRTVWQEQAVVTKALKSNSQTPNAIARYHHEFNLNQSLTSPYICRALAMDDRKPRIIFEERDRCKG